MPLILIVDDSPTELHVMQKALEKHGYRTAAAADGAEGLPVTAAKFLDSKSAVIMRPESYP